MINVVLHDETVVIDCLTTVSSMLVEGHDHAA